MLKSKSFVRKTKQGKVVKVVREHYLRDDIYCEASFCKVCDSSAARLSSSASTILIVDTNVVLNQIDLLENPAIDDVFVLSMVLEEVKNKNLAVYNRIRALCSDSMRKIFRFFYEYHKRHPSPTKEMLEPLLHTAAAVGLNLDMSTSKALADSLDRAVGDDPYLNKLIRILATRCMTQFTSVVEISGPQKIFHYGLAAPLYTHFTSPIRRYADVVHRLLAASLGIYKLPIIFQDRPQLTSIADNLNYPHRNALMASSSSVELHTLIYFRKRSTDTEARIVKIRSNGFIVFIPKYGIEGPVYLTSRGEKGGGEWFVDKQQQKVKKIDGSISYSVLQTVRIHMEVVEPQPNRPKLQLTRI